MVCSTWNNAQVCPGSVDGSADVGDGQPGAIGDGESGSGSGKSGRNDEVGT